MAINPELITTIRVDQLPDGTLNLTNKIPHTGGTVLEKASVQDLVDLVATAIGVSGGVGYIALSVTDGQQLPDVPELPSFFLCGAGTFLNINGYPNIICTENLNAIMSLTDHWELAVEIPINPLSGTVQSVTGSAVDNTDPLNPVINITGTTPTLQEVLNEGNTASTNNLEIIVGPVDDLSSVLSMTPSTLITAVDDAANNKYVSDTKDLTDGYELSVYDDTLSLNSANKIVVPFKTSGSGITTFKVQNNLPSGDYELATLDDIPTGGGIPHATASGTDTYTATITGVAAYNDADAYLIRFTNGNTTSATLNINSLGAVPLYRNNDGPLLGGDILEGGEMLCIYNSTLNEFQVIGISPNSLIAYVTNDDSVTITKGMPVYAFSGTGDRMTVKRANNSADATSAQTVGLVLSTSIAAGQKGVIMMQGLLDGLSTLPTATFADGDPIYVGSTAGTITNVKPYAPNHLVYLGVVTTASNGSAGRMYVRVQNGYELSEIHDVDLITNAPTNNQALTYETSTDLWKNKTIIEDSITNGVTTIAPSQNAVFDALALKQNALSFTPYKFIQTSQTAHTGTTAETILATATIAGGTFNTSDVAKVLFGINKTGTGGTYSLRLKVNTTNTLVGATQIGLFTSAGATAQMSIMSRSFSLNGGNLYGYSFAGNALTDVASIGGALSSTAYNTANTLYFFWTVQLANAGDSIIPNLTNLTN